MPTERISARRPATAAAAPSACVMLPTYPSGQVGSRAGPTGISQLPAPSPAKAERAAKRVIVQARKGTNAALSVKPGLVLHEADGQFTPAAQAVLRHAGGLGVAVARAEAE